MSKKKYFIRLTTVVLITMFILLPILRSIGVPMYEDLLLFLFGEPNKFSITLSSLLTLFLIGMVIRSGRKSTTNHKSQIKLK